MSWPFSPEWWPHSNRNAGRFPSGMVAVFPPERWLFSSGIRTWPRIEELNGDMRTVAELIGIGNALKLAQRFDGTPVRIYGWKTWTRSWRDRCIRRDYDSGKYSGGGVGP